MIRSLEKSSFFFQIARFGYHNFFVVDFFSLHLQVKGNLNLRVAWLC